MSSTLSSLLDIARRNLLRYRGIEFHLDVASANLFSGWARSTRKPTHRPLIELRAGRTIIGYTHAGDFREDLLRANIGDGCYGFTIAPAISMETAEPISVNIYIDGIKVNSRSHVIKPAFDLAFREFSGHMEQRLDALLALHQERTDREIAAIRKQLNS